MLSKVISWLRFLRLVISSKISRQFFNRWKPNPEPIEPCVRDFSRALSKLQVRAVFKWLSKVITWLWLLRLMIGLKDSWQFFSQWEAKPNPIPKPIAPCTRDFSRSLSKCQIIASNRDSFIALFVPVVIGRRDNFSIGFSTAIWKPVYLAKFAHSHLCLSETDIVAILFYVVGTRFRYDWVKANIFRLKIMKGSNERKNEKSANLFYSWKINITSEFLLNRMLHCNFRTWRKPQFLAHALPRLTLAVFVNNR